MGLDTLYINRDSIKNILASYLNDNKNAIEVYLEELHKAAKNIKDSAPPSGTLRSTGIDVSYEDAARYIHDADLNSPYSGTPSPGAGPNGCSKISLASRVKHFFDSTSGSAACGGTLPPPLVEVASAYWDDLASSTLFKNFYEGRYMNPSLLDTRFSCDIKNETLMTAFAPGPRHGADLSGKTEHPFFSGQSYLSSRNYYSTKFVAINNLTEGPPGSYYNNNAPIYQETSNLGTNPANLGGLSASSKNSLSRSDLSVFTSSNFNKLDH